MALPVDPPVEPMLAKLSDAIPAGAGWHYEPKWDGFRAIVFRDGDDVRLQGRDLNALDRYFPELVAPLRRSLPARAVVDGEIVIPTEGGLDFEALLARIHPAAARVALLAARAPAAFVVWDLLALGDEDMRHLPFGQRRRRLEQVLAGAAPPVFLTPATREREVAVDWFSRFVGAGLDGVVAKRLDDSYQPGERVMVKVKPERTADCVIGGFRWHANAHGTLVGALLLGLYDDAGRLRHVGVASGFSSARRRDLLRVLAPLRKGAAEGHPWHDWGNEAADGQRLPRGSLAGSRGRQLAWEPLRPERVGEVAYDHLQGDRFRHATHFRRWRPDKRPRDCGYVQLEEQAPFELARLLAPEPAAAAPPALALALDQRRG